MRDASNVLQQQAIGILGVNLVYAAFYEVGTQESFLEGLAQDVVAERIEIDYVDLRGPAFESWDHRALQVHLVRAGLVEAVFFPAKGSSFLLPRFFTREPSC
jgi:lantibiotic modifying enzyme